MNPFAISLLLFFSAKALAQPDALQSCMQRLNYFSYVKDTTRTANLLTFRALNYAAAQLKIPEQREAAAQAVLQIASQIYKENAGQVKWTLTMLIDSVKTDALADQAKKLQKRVIKYKKKEPQAVRFRLQVIDAASPFEAGTFADINHDGRLDIFCGGSWYSAPDWQKHFVREVYASGGYHADFASYPMDVDEDGWCDIVNGSWIQKNIFWLKNPGQAGGAFSTLPIDEPDYVETLLAVDITGDGKADILPNTSQTLLWYEYDQSKSSGYWKKHAWQEGKSGHGMGAGDVNGDGRVDIIMQKGWLEQVSAANDSWLWHSEWQKLPSASVPMLVHDVDQDGDADILFGAAHDYGLYWLEQTGKWFNQLTWQLHLMDDTWSQPHLLILADLDTDGRDELITGKRYYAHNGHDPGEDHPLCIYYYDLDNPNKRWTRHVVHEGGRVGFGIYSAAADMDKDGDIDLLAPGKSGLYLLENLGNQVPH